jgi:DNA ligase-1
MENDRARATAAPLPFQVTMRRFGRKLEVGELRAELPLAVFFFDCLRRDGEDLVARPARDRFAALADALPPGLAIPRIVTGDVAEGEAFLAGALAAGHEGVMAKALDAPYEAGRRGAGWLKIKRAHTLDLVVWLRSGAAAAARGGSRTCTSARAMTQTAAS